jgi:hypothetical protein
MRAHTSGRVTSFVTERDAVRWRKILHLTGYDVSDAVRTTLALDTSMSKISFMFLLTLYDLGKRDAFLNIVLISRQWRIPVAVRSKAWFCGRSPSKGCEFEYRRAHGCLSVVSVVCCQVEVSATG